MDDDAFTVICGESGGALNVEVEAAGVWIPLHGSLQVHTASPFTSVSTGEVLVTELNSRTALFGHANAWWLGLLGSGLAWRHMLSSMCETSVRDPQLLPCRHQAGHALQRRAKELAQAAGAFDQENAAFALIYSVIALQASMHSAIARCPGRTYAKKKQVFLRLQRVRNYISACCDQEINCEALAHMASYTPAYFVHTFKEAFLETPHAYLVSQRLQRARRLLCMSDLPIAEIADANSCERNAFTRSFRKRFGTSAMDMRRQIAGIG